MGGRLFTLPHKNSRRTDPAELLKLDVEKLMFLLDLLEIDYSFLDEKETRLEKEAVEKLLDELKNKVSA